MKKILFIFVCALLITSCGTIKYPYLVGTDDNDTEVYQQRGDYTLQLENFDDNISVTVEGLDVGAKDVSAVYVGIENGSDELYNFVDSNIEIFGGNKDTGEWTSLGLWDADAYYEKVVIKEQKARALAILSLILRIFSDSSSGNTKNSTGVLSSGLGMAATASAGDAISSSYFGSSKWLKTFMLYSSQVRKNTTYSGVVVFDGRNGKKKAFPDYKVVFNNNGEDSHEFILQRSDRESVINPWLDKPFARMTWTLSFDPLHSGAGSMFIYNHPTSIGFYSAMMFGKGIFTLPLGITYKPFSNTWLMAGGDIIFGKNGNDIAPQLGVNVVSNWISVFALAEYAFKIKQFGFTFGMGYAFTLR